jgi:hypothetical protein
MAIILASCASSKDVTNQSVVVLDKAVQIVPQSWLGFEQRVTIVVSFNESGEKLHAMMLCLCDYEAKACSLIDWKQTNMHPSHQDFERNVNDAWLESHPNSELRFREMQYHPEPVGPLMIEAVYLPEVVLNKK